MVLKTLESPLVSKEIKRVNPKGNQFWIFTGKIDAEAEAPILCQLMWRANSLEEILILGKTEGRRRKGQQRIRWLDGITYSMDISFSKLQEIVKERKAWRTAVCTQSQTRLSNRTTTCVLRLYMNWLLFVKRNFSNIYPYFNYY